MHLQRRRATSIRRRLYSFICFSIMRSKLCLDMAEALSLSSSSPNSVDGPALSLSRTCTDTGMCTGARAHGRTTAHADADAHAHPHQDIDILRQARTHLDADDVQTHQTHARTHVHTLEHVFVCACALCLTPPPSTPTSSFTPHCPHASATCHHLELPHRQRMHADPAKPGIEAVKTDAALVIVVKSLEEVVDFALEVVDGCEADTLPHPPTHPPNNTRTHAPSHA